MDKRELEIKNRLLNRYRGAKSELNYTNNFELLVAVMLSAQCLDARVNIITPALFKHYPDAQSMSKANLASVRQLISSCNFFQNKSRNLIASAKAICEQFNGEVPLEFDQLISLPGVGEKTANVVLAESINANVMAVDTHIFRVAKRLELSHAKTPNDCAKDLAALFKTDLAALHKGTVLFGRYICKARKPDCQNCFLSDLCSSAEPINCGKTITNEFAGKNKTRAKKIIK